MGGQLLEGKRESMFRVDPETLTIIGVDTDDGPEHQLWDERTKLPLDDAMVKNIMALGVREPVIIVVEGKGNERRALVVDGRRRVMHIREANKRLSKRGEPKLDCPVVAEKGMSEGEQTMLAASLNEIRMEDPVMVKAAKAARMKARGATYQDIALAFGVETQTVALWVNINGLADPVKKAVADGRLKPTAAGALAGLTPEKQKETLAELLADAAAGVKPTVNRAKNRAKGKKAGAGGGDPPVEAPQRRVLRRVVKGGEKLLSEDFIRGIRFAIGDLNPSSIKGLTALMSGKDAAD
jgi:ParB family chromosome partitioning protein